MARHAFYRTQKRRGAVRFFSARQYDGIYANEIRVVAGHYLGRSMEARFPDQRIERSILLRDPVSHLISYYNFRMMRYISQGLHPYSFELAYQATQRNFITHYILRNFLELPWLRIASLGDADKYDIVNAFLSTFWYVGDYSLCDDLVSSLGLKLGISCRAIQRNTKNEWKRRVSWTPLSLEDLSADAVARIRQENLLDQRLWETWRQARHNVRSVYCRLWVEHNLPDFVTSETTHFVAQILRRLRRHLVPHRIDARPAFAENRLI
jgi:hypothetical protein